ELREQEWVRRQPPATQKRLASLSAPQRKREVTRLRAEQRQRQREAMRLGPPRRDKAKTALPEVPERALFHFLWIELSQEERDRLRLSLRDPAARERVKQEYFKRHPRELRRLQQLDFRPRKPIPKDRLD
ncbi:MAG: hypothetical protein HYS12_09115, partial [Planctomycetes bacterium]|nr:hypothetical protein [Planctomycetota bacterium]